MLGGSAGVSGDVLAGRDLEITWEDVYRGKLFSLFQQRPEGDWMGEGKANMDVWNVFQATTRERVSIFMWRWREGLGWTGRPRVERL